MSAHSLFVEAVKSAEELPPEVRSNAANVTELREQRLDVAYVEGFNARINLNKHWEKGIINRMKQRQAALQPFCGVTLLFGRVKVGLSQEYEVVVHPATGAVIDWEYCVQDYGL